MDESNGLRKFLPHKRIMNFQEINKHLLAHHQRHFGQATNTPFTIAPLKDLVGYMAEGPLAQDLKKGIANIDALGIDEYTKDILQEMQWKETDPPKNSLE
eukprot:14425748-Ditylum_brightwellii.AAC.1